MSGLAAARRPVSSSKVKIAERLTVMVSPRMKQASLSSSIVHQRGWWISVSTPYDRMCRSSVLALIQVNGGAPRTLILFSRRDGGVNGTRQILGRAIQRRRRECRSRARARARTSAWGCPLTIHRGPRQVSEPAGDAVRSRHGLGSERSEPGHAAGQLSTKPFSLKLAYPCWDGQIPETRRD
jgi:hypothetical protein